MKFLKTLKAKFFLMLGAMGLVTTNALAKITYSADTGFSGELDLTPFYSAVVIIIGAFGVIMAVKMAIALFRR